MKRHLRVPLLFWMALYSNSALSRSGQFALGVIPDGGSDDDIVINYTPAPEPTSLALLGLAAGGLMIRRRRKLESGRLV